MVASYAKKWVLALGALALVVGSGAAFAAGSTGAQEGKKETSSSSEQLVDMKKLSEAFGHFIGRNLKNPGLSFDLDSLIVGIRAGAEGKPAPMSDAEYEEMMAAVQERAFKEMSTTNLNNANQFLDKNKEEKGVVELVPGKLQYLVLQEGNGAVVEPHFTPKLNYTGRYQDGTVFGSSEEMGGPISIPLDQTIPGFSKGIVGMKEGEKRRIFVHPDLGYGTTGQLPPNELLIFEVELVKAQGEDSKKDAGAPDQQLLGENDDDLGDDDQDDDGHDELDNSAKK